jgi:hypothetical protein
MRDFGLSGQADPAKRRSSLDDLVGHHNDASLFKVAILGTPPIAVVDYQAIAAFLAGYCCPSRNANRNVADAVARAQYASSRRRQYRDTILFRLCVDQPDVRTVMIVVGARAAPEIPGRVAAVVIDKVLYETSLPEFACDRPDQHKWFIRADNCKRA